MTRGRRLMWIAAQRARRRAAYHVGIAMAEARLRWDGLHPDRYVIGAARA
ncbi:MAG: hypothetical protein AAF360_00885 [Pseudomonadota bacterium]